MIAPKREIDVAAVAAHYDELDVFYREIWGEHVHHGLWRSGRETAEQATLALLEHVAELARIAPGDEVCDIGSGYGATARWLVDHCGARVTALTVTPAQHRFASMRNPGGDNPVYLLRDWHNNALGSESFDAAIAIESMPHMADKKHALSEAARVLKPGGRLVMCVWLAGDHPNGLSVRHLLEPICREGRLTGLATETEYRGLLTEAGFDVRQFDDVSREVRRTWAICIARALKAVCVDRRYRQFLLNARMRNREFLLTMFRILAAYHLGAMRYGIVAARKTR
ncbi:MAG: SAM-dependent methyltransferase [Gammaproteobacteria bacterium]